MQINLKGKKGTLSVDNENYPDALVFVINKPDRALSVALPDDQAIILGKFLKDCYGAKLD